MDRLEKTFADLGIDISSIPRASDFKADGNRFKDADTFTTDTGEDIRIQGINAAETSKIDPSKKLYQGFQPGADMQTMIVADVARKGGFTNPIVTENKDQYGRSLGDLTDPYGNKLSNKLLEMGVVNPSLDVSREQLTSSAFGALERAQRKFEGKQTEADKLLDSLNEERNKFGVMAKIFTPDAKSFGAAIAETGSSDFFAGPSIVREGEDRQGFATSNLSTGLDIGFSNMKQGLYGTLDMIGRTTGSELLTNIGKSNVRLLQAELEDLPYLRNAEAFDENGEWKLDSFSKFTDYLIGTAASSTPQMISSLVAAFAAPATFGLSLTIPAATYIGNTWNAQKEKNATAAILSGITQTVLDKIGIKGISGNITSKATQEAVVSQLIKNGMTKDAAEKLIVSETKEALKQVSDAARQVALKQTIGGKAIGKQAIEGGISEGVTEGLQELTQYFGEQGSIALPTEGEEVSKLQNRILNAATGGALLGSTISSTATGVRTLTTSTKPSQLSTDAKFREQFGSSVPYAEDIIKEVDNMPFEADLNKLAEMENTKRAIQGIPSKLSSWWQDKGLSSLWDKWSNTIMGDNIHKSKYTAALATLLGSGNPLNGSSIHDKQVMIETNLHKNFGTKEEFEAAFDGMHSSKASLMLSNPVVVDFMERLVRKKKSLFANDMSQASSFFDADKDLGEFSKYKSGIIEYANRMDNLINAYNSATNSQLKFSEFLEQRPLDKTIVSRYFNNFVSDIQSVLGLSVKDAQKIANSVLNNDTVNSVEDALDDILNFDVASLKNKDVLAQKLYEPENRGKFARYFSHDLVDNAYTLSARGAAKNINFNIIGKNGEKLAGLIQAAINNGDITEEEASFMAKEIKDFLDMRAGNYHPITNPYIKGALSTINFLSTIVSLPLAAISSTVEFAQVYRNLNSPQTIKATRVLLKTFGKEFAALYRDIGSRVTDKIKVKPTEHRIALSNAGYLREGGIAHRTDVLSGYFQKWTEGFFKVTGLTSVTSITRHAKLAIAADAINDWLSTIKSGDSTSQDVIDAKEHLIRLGVDVEYLLDIDKSGHSLEIEKKVFDIFQRASYNFVNEAVVIPSQLNRPNFDSDPYLRLFTQFQGYVSTFTSNVLPRLIGDLSKKGSADQRNSAAVIAMMFALSMLALYIKDMIKYGESPPEWLDDDKEFQRVIGQMGILGTAQRVWDAVSNITGNDRYSKTVLGDVYDKISSQSPQLAFLNKVNQALSAPEGKEIEKGARLLPVFGTSPAFAKYLQKELGE